jgi:hypothetical protein
MMPLKRRLMLPLGMISLAFALLIDRFLPHDSTFDFIVGVLIGMSIVLNLVGIHYGAKYVKTL